MVRQARLVVVLDRVDFVVKHLFVRILPKKHAQADGRSQAHIGQYAHRQLNAKHRRLPVEVRDSVPIERILKDNRKKGYKVKNWHAISEEERNQDGHVSNGHAPVEIVFGTAINIKPGQVVEIVALPVLIHKVFLVPSDGVLHLVLSYVVYDRLEAEDGHGNGYLGANGLVPASFEISEFAGERVLDLVPVINFSKVHSDHNRQDSDVKNVTYDDHVAVYVLFGRVSLVANHGHQRPSDEVERVVDEEKRAAQNEVVPLLVLAIEKILFANLSFLDDSRAICRCSAFSTLNSSIFV